ncbi:uncharacterized protein LACBIDRAFT_333570 [Laccaria bicolor S238N-H82]|uniref:Predicted protein n=1 Tax=Laccaria bicolor (strain S238N-H82 / ATCC MYA-4686) TaxID=486041 RepID=B0DWC6_LACBS|nr:uncharacterized protein LACBIDRAFT_333570 [Laccaria bicolor S238N-H82]EDR01025.1 predicted protein [Laccaria bicolor S238N-H82]|eukprot:XP_001888244.1 predicted protein [Laccaria bicolor S238N-H82]
MHIPSPKLWTSYVFRSRNDQNSSRPVEQTNGDRGQGRTPARNNEGPPSGGSTSSGNDNDLDRRGNPPQSNPPPSNWYVPPRGNEGGGGGEPGGGGGGGGGGNGNHNNPDPQDPNYPPWWRTPEEWQINRKLNANVLPEWDGAGETAIDYLSRMGFLAALSSKMKEGIAQLAPFKWTSYALSWWETLPTPDRTYFQYFTLPHEFRRTPVDSHRMSEFHPESTGMVGISNSSGFCRILNGIPMDSIGF